MGTSVARGEFLAVNAADFVRLGVVRIVSDFIDPGRLDGIAGLEYVSNADGHFLFSPSAE